MFRVFRIVKPLILLSLLVLLLFSIPLSSAEEASGDYQDIHWELDKTDTLRFSGSGSIPENGPWSPYSASVKTLEIGGNISTIDYNAFANYKNLTSVIIGKSVESICDGAFFVSNKIKQFDFRSIYPSFNPLAFSKELNFKISFSDDSPYKIENNMILSKDGKKLVYYLGKGKAIIPEGITTICWAAFWEKDDVTDIVLPSTIIEIHSFAFGQCDKLTSITFPKSSFKVGGNLFQSCKALKTVTFPNDEMGFIDVSESQGTFEYCSGLEKIIMPTVIKIPRNAFYDCSKLKTIILRNGTKEIGNWAFAKCKSLRELYIPKSVEQIHPDAIDFSSKDLKIYCEEGSYAESFAKENRFAYSVFIPTETISLSEIEVALQKGKSATLSYSIMPETVTLRNVEWFSSNPTIATVNNGVIKSNACGECDIICKATDGSGVQAVCHVSVIQMIQNIQAKDKKITIPFDGTYQSEITIKPDDATNCTLSWISSDESICQVNDNGLITAVGAGDCEITCTSTDGSNKNLAISVHVPVFSDTRKEITVTNKDGITIPFDTHGLSLYYIQHKATTDKYFLYSLDKSGLHIYPIAEGSAKITLSNKLAPKDQIVYNVTIDKEAVFDNSNGDSEPLSIIIVPDKSVARVGDKVTFTYFVKGNVADVSYQGIQATGSNGYGGGGGSYQKTQKGKNAGTLSINTKNYASWQRIGFTITAVDTNGNTAKKECFAWVEDALGLTAVSDTLVAKVGVPVNIYVKCSGGIPPYSVDISTTVAGKQTRYTQSNIKQDYSFSVDPGAFPDVTMTCHFTIKDSKGCSGFAPSLLIDVKNEEPITCNPHKLIYENKGNYYIEINEGMNRPDIALQAYYGCEDKEEYIYLTGEYLEPINVQDNLWEFTLDRNPLGIDINASSESSAAFASVLFKDIQEIE